MSYSDGEKLPEDYFKSVMEEKAEMLRKYLRDIGNSFSVLDPYWTQHGSL